MAIHGNTMHKDAVNLLRILEAIPRNKIVSVQEISAKMMSQGILLPERTVRRYLDSMVEYPDLFQIEVIKSTRPFGYKWKNNATVVSFPLMTPGEALLVGLEKQRFLATNPPQLVQAIKQFLSIKTKPAIEKLSEKNKDASWVGKLAWLPDTYQFATPRITKTVLERIAESLLYGKRLLIRALIKDPDTGLNVWKDLNVFPIGAVVKGVRTYLVCQPKRASKPIRIPMNRIIRAVIWVDNDEDVTSTLADYIDEEMNEEKGARYITLSFTTDDLTLIEELKETPLNSSQKIKCIATNKFLVTANLKDTPLLDGWLGYHQASILQQSKMPAKLSSYFIEKTENPSLVDLADEKLPQKDLFGIEEDLPATADLEELDK